MPLPLLLALFLAFGFEMPTPGPSALPGPGLVPRLAGVLGMLALIAVGAWGWGRWGVARVARDGNPSLALRRRFARGARLLEITTVAAYGAVIHEFGWPSVVREGLGGGGPSVVQDALIVLPFILMQLAYWWGIYAGEQAMRSGFSAPSPAGVGRHLVLRARQSLGLVLPVLVIFALGQDVVRRHWPGWSSSVWAQPIEVGMMGVLVVVASPLFLRLAWPTRRLPRGPLRDRLEELAGRLGFRCSDILVWDTGGNMVNACVTGSLPCFRYVLLTDALIDCLDEYEIAAVFGHEIGHIAHRHLLYFGFFFVSSLAVLAILGEPIDERLFLLTNQLLGPGHPMLGTIVQAGVMLSAVGLYTLVVFGHVSRWFERQADVFGCQAVSCGQPGCPPHVDVGRLPETGSSGAPLCPIGIRIFANALRDVAQLNGIEPGRRSWRHGSIAQRIAFLEGLEGHPDALRRFQAGVSRLRLVMAMGLVAAVVVALAADPARLLR